MAKKIKKSEYAIEVESVLARIPAQASPENREAYIGGGQSELRYLGLRVPDLHRAFKQGFSFSSMPSEEVAKIWDQIWWSSDCFEVMALALEWFDQPKQRRNLLGYWPLLQKWSERIDNWAHSDSLSSLYARIHEQSPSMVYPVFKRWSQSGNPWLRRLSIVSLFYYSSQRQVPPPFSRVIALVKPQLAIDHHYVQKGVGWTLREAGNVYPEQAYAFLEQNVTRLSAQAFASATEKLAKRQREHLKKLRREMR